MLQLNKIKTLLSYATKQKYRAELQHALVTPKGISAHDLETGVLIKSIELPLGVYKIVELGEFCKTSETVKVDDLPNIDWKQKEDDKIHVGIKTLETINKHSSDDETRIFLNSIYFDSENIVATNSYHLKAVKHDQNINSQYIIPNGSIDILVKLCKAFKTINIKLSFNENWVTVDTLEFTWQSRLINREYLKYQAVIPKKWNNKLEIKNFPELKTYKPFLEKRKEKSVISLVNGEIFFIIPSTDIKIKIGESDNKDFEIGFNPLFLEIARENKRDFIIKWNSELSPVLVNESIVMPLKL